jgi:hypothetical protein
MKHTTPTDEIHIQRQASQLFKMRRLLTMGIEIDEAEDAGQAQYQSHGRSA